MTRTIPLSEIMDRTKNMVEPQVVIAEDSRIGSVSILGVRLAEEVRAAANLPGRIQSCAVISAPAGSPNLNLKFSSELNPDNLQVDHQEGRGLRLHLAKVMQAKNLRVPAGCRMVIPLRGVTDPEFGPCLQLALDAATVVPRRRGRGAANQTAAAVQPAPGQKEENSGE